MEDEHARLQFGMSGSTVFGVVLFDLSKDIRKGLTVASIHKLSPLGLLSIRDTTRYVFNSKVSLRKRTAPSPIKKWAPPECELPKPVLGGVDYECSS